MFQWSNGPTTRNIAGLAAGSYTVTVKDNASMTKIQNWTVTSPPPLMISEVITNVLCFGGNNGSVGIIVNGGTPPYTYFWSENVGEEQRTQANVNVLWAGNYSVIVTDAHACTATGNYTVTEPTSLMLYNSETTDPKCYGGADGSISVTVMGGTNSYSYKWSTGFTFPRITGLTAGYYLLTITDANNCSRVFFFDVGQPSALRITATPVKVTCPGGSNGQITTTVSGGSGGATTYKWTNGQTGATAINLTAGTYKVTVTNGAGCTASSLSTTVGTANPLPGSADAISGPDIVSQGQTGVVFSVAPIANATGYFWILPPGANTISGFNSQTITVDFSVSASSGNISVYGTNFCGNGTPAPDKYISVIPTNLILQNIIPGAGTTCYNAIQTIQVAGGSATFIVNSGVSVTMIAGQNIVYLPGTTVYNEGYMHGYITPNGHYCETYNPVVNNPVKADDLQVPVPEIVKSQNLRVFSTPTNSFFTLELMGTDESGLQKLDIYGMNGVRVLSESLSDERKHVFTVESLRPGIYFIHVTTGTSKETMKLIKLE